MKRFVMTLIVVLLVVFGGYCGWRYYSDVYLPNKKITDTEKEQRILFEKIKPDFELINSTLSAESTDDVTENTPYQSLVSENGEAVGWITVEGTVIDYPVVQAADNAYYLNHGFDRNYNYGLGCPFLDYRCESDFNGFNSIIYAHHIQDYRALFSDITLYGDSAFMKQHPEGTLLTKNGVRKVRFFAYMVIPNPSFAYITGITAKKDRESYIDSIFKNAVYTNYYSSEEMKKNDKLRLLLLSTCSYDYWNARSVLAGVIE